MFGDYLKAIEKLRLFKKQVKEESLLPHLKYLENEYKRKLFNIQECMDILTKAWEDEEREYDKQTHELGRYENGQK